MGFDFDAAYLFRGEVNTSVGNDQAIWLHIYVAVERQALIDFTIFVIIATTAIGQAVSKLIVADFRTDFLASSTKHEAFITAAKHVAIATQHSGICAYLTTTDVHIGRTKDIALRAEVKGLCLILGHPAVTSPVVIASATAEHVAHHMTVVQVDMRFTSFIDFCHTIRNGSFWCSAKHSAASDRANLATTIQAATHDTIPHPHVGNVGIAIGHITSTEDVATEVELVVVRLFIVQFSYIFIMG